MSASVAGYGSPDIGRVRDDCAPLAAAFKKKCDGFDFGAHAAAWKLAFLQQLLGLGQRQPVEPLLIGLIEIDGDFFDRGRDNQKIDIELIAQ